MEWWKKDFCLQSHTGYQASSFLLLLWYQRESLVWVLYLWKVIGIFFKCFSDDSVLFFTAQELFFHRYLGLILSSWFECTLHNSGGWRISSIKFLSCHVHSFIVVELSVKWILDPSPGQAWRRKVVRNDPSPGKWLSVNNRTKTNSFFFRDFKASSLVRKNKSCAYEWVQMTALI